MCQAFCRAHRPGPVWDPRVGLKTSDRARSSPCDTDFPNPDLSDRFHTSVSFSRIFEVMPLTLSVSHQRSPSKLFVLRDHGPQHARHLVRQRDGRKHSRLAGKDASEPGVLCRRSDFGTGNHCHRPDDQQAPNVPLPGLARAPKPRLATARMLPGHKAQPCREVTPLPEAFHRWSEGSQSH